MRLSDLRQGRRCGLEPAKVLTLRYLGGPRVRFRKSFSAVTLCSSDTMCPAPSRRVSSLGSGRTFHSGKPSVGQGVISVSSAVDE